ncbi:serine/threonine protein kinase [bacterium]|nr:serine/threonine protein kinase [bacterium]
MSVFDQLLPEVILNAVEDQGYLPTGYLFPLNSYENRVYEIGIEGAPPIIGKFYRPGRWGEGALLDEHRFIKALVEAEFPVVAPLELKKTSQQEKTLGFVENYYFALFPRFRGAHKAELMQDDRKWMGRHLARLHNVGASFKAKHRLPLNPQTYGEASLSFILSQPHIPDDLKKSIDHLLNDALDLVEPFFNDSLVAFTTHGDCHWGNVLWNHDGPHFLDFDDMVIAPPVQDIWMLFSGTPDEVKEQKNAFLEGYSVFRDFDEKTFILSEPLRTLRLMRMASWIGERYEEEAFKRAFPYYRDRRYWEEFLLSIKEQIGLLQELY